MSNTPPEKLCPRYAKNWKKAKSVNFLNLAKNDANGKNSSTILLNRDKQTISDLMTELAQVLAENVKLTNANILLRCDVQQSNDKVKNLEVTLSDERKRFTSSLTNIQEKLTNAERLLEEREKVLTQENEAKTNEINKLADSYYRQCDLAKTKEDTLKNEIDTLKQQLDKSKGFMEDLLNQLKTAKSKAGTYKEKLKFCVNLITEMNAFLGKFPGDGPKRTESSDRSSQTEDQMIKLCRKECNCRGCSMECEGIVLSDLFFQGNALHSAVDDVIFSLNQNG